jgi:hypothetical protein
MRTVRQNGVREGEDRQFPRKQKKEVKSLNIKQLWLLRKKIY